ncbi:hypothetical protein C8R45DRAFT_538652 [Mycena sanguinolenta]|nr:hypothetical protein C8R45DRAFT_538652 [Mycena sanguinolenta]
MQPGKGFRVFICSSSSFGVVTSVSSEKLRRKSRFSGPEISYDFLPKNSFPGQISGPLSQKLGPSRLSRRGGTCCSMGISPLRSPGIFVSQILACPKRRQIPLRTELPRPLSKCGFFRPKRLKRGAFEGHISGFPGAVFGWQKLVQLAGFLSSAHLS